MKELLLGMLIAGTYPAVHSIILIRYGILKPSPRRPQWWVLLVTLAIPVLYLVMLVLYNLL